ncbi:RNA polymerase sigma factor [Chryseomicrobium excrementi]|nr:RNA polymerase sigma factor [Chryseomicrobium excrementi]
MDRSQFQQLYTDFAPDLYRMALAITGRRELAKDALQETFLRVYRFSDQWDSSRPIRPWLYRILINECHRLLKKEKAQVPMETHHLETLVPSGEIRVDILDAVATLPEEYRVPLLLKYMENWKEREIAEALSLNLNTLKSRLTKARALMREAYGEG